jgi:hypothetical protein
MHIRKDGGVIPQERTGQGIEALVDQPAYCSLQAAADCFY